eukprot:TRINITY_DN60326_c0_g1_i1.p1 TRINITY_DN60326_c0_g1~~TRINITY_DN60326_c0_g1_i1.p1  ORF type:complete len:496 (+),score=107.46 TRINITY_DN60326_c0_g1_i1:95-1582(+)
MAAESPASAPESKLSPAAQPFTPSQGAAPLKSKPAASAWRMQAESLAREGSKPPAKPSNPVQVTDEEGHRVTLTPPSMAATPPPGVQPAPRSAPAGPVASPPAPPAPGPPSSPGDTLRIVDEDGGCTKLWFDEGKVMLEIEKTDPQTRQPVQPALRVVSAITIFTGERHLRFACIGPDWNIVVSYQGHEMMQLCRRLNLLAHKAGITASVDALDTRYGAPVPGAGQPLLGYNGYHPALACGMLPGPPPPRGGGFALPALRHAPAPCYGGKGRGSYQRYGGGGGRPPAPFSAQYQGQADLVSEIQGLLEELGEEDWPQGLRQMPLPRLKEYREALLKRKRAAGGMAPTTSNAPIPVGSVVRYVGGGRYHGRREWWDGDVLDVGMVGIITDADEEQQWPYRVSFHGLWPTRLGAADLDVLALSVEAAGLRVNHDGQAITQVEHAAAGGDPADWEALPHWEPPPPRPPDRPTGPVKEKVKVRRDPGGGGGKGRRRGGK